MATPDLLTRIVISAQDKASGVIGKIAAGLAALGAGVGLVSATKKAADFEAALDLIQSKTEANAEEMARFEAAALKAGSETAYTATEAAAALAILGAAGLSATDSIATLPSVLALAAAEGIGLEQAAGLVTDTVTVMGLSFAESARATDVMVKAANLSSVSATQMGESLKYAGAEAKNAGLSIEETAAVIDVLAKNGLRGEQAGTALRSILAQLGDPAGSARKELAALGITTGDLRTVIDGVKAAGPQAGAAIRAFGVESGPALQALIAGGSAAIDDYAAQLKNAGGAAQTAASVMNDNLSGAFSGLSSAWDTLSIALTKPLLEPIKEQVIALTEKFRVAASDGSLTAFSTVLVNGFNAVAEQIKSFAGAVDWSSFGQRIKDFATNSAAALKEWGNNVGVVTGYVSLAFQSVKTGVGVLETAFWTLAGVGAKGLEGLSGAVAGTSALTESFAASAEVNFGKAGQSLADTAEEAEALRAAWERMNAPAKESGDIAKQAAETVFDLQAHYADAAQALLGLTDGQKTAAVVAVQAEAAKQAALQATQAELRRLSAEYEKALAQGDLGKAAGILSQLNAIRQGARETADSAGQMSKEVADAFQSLGVTSQAELDQLAENARQDFATIRDAGTSAPADIEAAFIAYAEKAIAANNGVADSALRAAAAQRGLQVQAGATGDTVVSSNQQVTSSNQQVSDSTQQTNDVQKSGWEILNELNAAKEASAQASQDLARADTGAGAASKWMAEQMDGAVSSIRQYSESAASAVDAIIKSVGSWNSKIAEIGKLDASAFIATDAASVAKAELAALVDGAEQASAAAQAFASEWTGAFNVFGKFYAGMSVVKDFEAQVASAAVAAKRMEIETAEMGAAMDGLAGQFEQGDLSLAEYIVSLERLRGTYGALGDERLEGLRAAIADAKQQMTDFAESAQDGLRDLQAEWADLNGQQIDAMLLEQQLERIAVEMELAQAKKDGNADAIAALTAQLALLDQIHAKQLANLAEEEAQKAIDDAEDAAREAERWAGLTDEERQHETALNLLQDALADAILAKNAALKQSILDQIAAENARHELVMANLADEGAAQTKPPATQTAPPGTTGGATPPAAPTAPVAIVRAVNMTFTAPSGATATARVLEGDDDVMARFFRDLESGRAVAQ